MKSLGSCRSNPNDVVKFCGFLKSGSVTLIPAVPAWPAAGTAWLRHDFGSVVMLVTKSGVAAPVQFNVTSPRPVFAYALPTRIAGVGPVKMPIAPRIWFLLSPVGSQLKPTRGDHSTCVFGLPLVFTAGSPAAVNAAAILSFWTGVSRYCGTSARTPYVIDSLFETDHWSCAYRLYCAVLKSASIGPPLL